MWLNLAKKRHLQLAGGILGLHQGKADNQHYFCLSVLMLFKWVFI